MLIINNLVEKYLERNFENICDNIIKKYSIENVKFIKNNEWIQKMKSNNIEINVEECCMGYGLCDLCRKCYRRD